MDYKRKMSDKNALVNSLLQNLYYTVKPVFSGHSKIDKTKVLKTNGSLIKVKSITECSLGPYF